MNIFRNSNLLEKAQKLCSLLAIAAIVIVYIFLFAVVTGIAGRIQDTVTLGLGLDPRDPFTSELFKLIFIFGSVYLFYRLTLLVWRKPEAAIDWGLHVRKYQWKDFFIGVVLGILAQYLFVRLMESAGYWIKGGNFGLITLAFLPVIFTALSEELVYRAYLYQTTVKLTNIPAALFLSATVFGIAHNKAYSVAYGIPLELAFIPAFVGGLVFAYAYRINNNLWLPIGLHCAWNYFGGIFGSVISPEAPAMMKLLVEMMVLVCLIVIFVEWMLLKRRENQPQVVTNTN